MRLKFSKADIIRKNKKRENTNLKSKPEFDLNKLLYRITIIMVIFGKEKE